VFRTLRALWRIIAFLWITLTLYLWFELNVLIHGIDSAHIFSLRTVLYRTWGRRVARAFGMHLTVKGEAPKAPYFFVMNHIGYVDLLIAALTLHEATFIAKHEMKDWLLIGPLATRLGAIYVDRGSIHGVANVTAQVDRALRAGYGVGMAPEATTTRGETVIPFHSAFFEPAIKLGVPVHYAAISFSTPEGEPPAWTHVSWWQHELTFQAHCWRLLQLNKFYAEIHFCDAPIQDDNRKALARRLHEATLGIFKPLVTADGRALDDVNRPEAARARVH
jgi:1-acyl-sn-glycerol-3-phosphate acyltransferase